MARTIDGEKVRFTMVSSTCVLYLTYIFFSSHRQIGFCFFLKKIPTVRPSVSCPVSAFFADDRDVPKQRLQGSERCSCVGR